MCRFKDLGPEMLSLTGEHAVLVLIAVSIAAAIAVPGAILLTRRAGARRSIMAAVNVVQTIPSLALFGFLLPIPLIGGIGKRTAIIALILYALLPMVRNTLTGILGVDRAVRESAIAMGMTNRQLLWQIELPLALPSILAGVRIATVATIGTATIAAAIGAGGLGTFIFRGIAMVDMGTVLAGAAPAALMAIVADEVLGWFERRVCSWS
jgi:osmoprotectant transport system permease protein